jgi:hypothetical protein
MHICGRLPRPSSSGTFICIHLNFWKWGLMWSLLVSTRMFELYIWEGLYLRTDTKKNTCYDEIGLCAQIYRHHTTFKSGHNWEDLSLCDASERVKFFSLTSSKVCISTRILKWQVFWFTIPNRRIQFAIGSTGLNCLWTWKCLQYAFFFSYYLVYRHSLCSLRSQNRRQSKFNSSRFLTFHSKFLCGGILQRHIKSLLAIRKKWDISPDSQMQIERCDADLYIAKVGRHLESADFNGVFVKLGPSFDLRGFAPRECLCNLQHPFESIL